MPPRRILAKKSKVASTKATRNAALAQRLATRARAMIATEEKQKMLTWTIQASTASQYASALRPLELFLTKMGKRSESDVSPVALKLQPDDYVLYLSAMASEKEKVPTGLHSALRKQQEVLGLEMWADRPDMQAVKRGLPRGW